MSQISKAIVIIILTIYSYTCYNKLVFSYLSASAYFNLYVPNYIVMPVNTRIFYINIQVNKYVMFEINSRFTLQNIERIFFVIKAHE